MARLTAFADFVELPENRSARLAVQELADGIRHGDSQPALIMLHGPAGCGKSTLADALLGDLSDSGTVVRRFDGNELNLPIDPRTPGKIFAASQAVTPSSESDWREAARTCDLLVVEDLQHLGPVTVEMLAEILDSRERADWPTLVTARVGPQHLVYRGSRFPARMTSRLAAGLVIHLQSPHTASRSTLLRALAARRQLDLDEDVLAWLAERMTGGPRQLLGVLDRIETLQSLNQCSDLAGVVQHFQQDAAEERVGLEAIARRVSAFFRLDARLLQGRSRSRSVLLPRQVSMFLARQFTLLSLEEIGAYFGGRDHSTVLHACRKVEQSMERDPLLTGAIRQLQAELA